MPVSKKRKKEGKPVHRATPVSAPKGEAHVDADAKPFAPQRLGKPSNPFVAMQQAKRGSQRGR